MVASGQDTACTKARAGSPRSDRQGVVLHPDIKDRKPGWIHGLSSTVFTHQTGFWLCAAAHSTPPGGGKGAAERRPGTAAPFNFPHSRSFRRAGAAVVRSSARLLQARDERTPEATAVGKRDRAGLPAVRPRSQPAESFLDPKSGQLPKPGARGSRGACPAHGPRGLRLALLPACASLPPPAADSDGLGPGLPAARRELGPAGPARSRPARNPTSSGVGPQGLRARVLGIGIGLRACVRGLRGRVSPFLEGSRQPCHGVQPICYLKRDPVALSNFLLRSLVASLTPQWMPFPKPPSKLTGSHDWNPQLQKLLPLPSEFSLAQPTGPANMKFHLSPEQCV